VRIIPWFTTESPIDYLEQARWQKLCNQPNDALLVGGWLRTLEAIVSVPSNILVPIDFEQTSEHALGYARDLAGKLGADLHVLHVVNDLFALSAGTEGTLTEMPQLQKRIEENARERIGDLITEEHRTAGVKAVIVTSSMPANAIVTYARDNRIDLIVMGSHGRGAAPASMIGSVAERVVRTAPCPVLTLRNPAP
jgi:nucleotide-binding universal stress UspA family protein